MTPKARLKSINDARRACGFALSYAAIIKDNLNELGMRIQYKESHELEASDECEIAYKIRDALKKISDSKEGL